MPVSSIAREEASLNEAWTAFLAHLPTMLLIWLASSAAIFIAWLVGFVALLLCMAIFAGGVGSTTGIYISMIISYIVQIPLWVLSQLVGVLFVAVPALYYAFGEVVTISEAFRTLFSRPLRYISAGILFSLAILIGSLFGIIPFIGVGLSMPDLTIDYIPGILPSLAIVGGLLVCFIPCILVCLTMPVYINKIFATEMSVLDAFASSFSAIYKSGKGWTFVGIQLLVGICIVIASLCTCGLGALVAVPVGIFYVQHTAYNKGLVS